MIGRLGRWLMGLAALIGAGFVALVVLTPDHSPPASSEPATGRPASPAAPQTIPPPARATPEGPASPRPSIGSVDCHAPDFDDAAASNAASLTALAWAPFHRAEVGWEIYAPRIASEIGSACAPGSPAFARALADWQRGRGLAVTGRVDAATFDAMNTRWELARPFVRLSHAGVCPDPPPAAALASARPDEGYAGKPVQLRPEALAAYRRLVAAARAASPVLATEHRLLTIFSGFRDPADDTARCAREGNCGNVSRALCSAHRTGLAVDLYLGSAPGLPPDTADDANRLYQARTPAYAWLIAHAGEYGFVNYPFEPWHWEWVGAVA
jgi:D-alanyl-D-alanine carboxypeptidase